MVMGSRLHDNIFFSLLFRAEAMKILLKKNSKYRNIDD